MARTVASLRKNKQFQTLVAVLGDEESAKIAFDKVHPEAAPVKKAKKAKKSAEDELVAAGFTPEQAKQALADEPEDDLPPAAALTDKERGAALVEEKGYGYAKGRVYGNPALAEAIVRVHRSGGAEIVQSSGAGRTAAMLVYREETGDIAIQNLIRA